jgi:hypothetical protein
MRPFTNEAAEKLIGLLCYGRTEDTFLNSARGVNRGHEGTYRLAVLLRHGPQRLVLSDRYEPAKLRTITVAEAVQNGLLAPSWEDLAAKLFLNDQDILLMCLLSHDEPLCLRFIEVERIKSYRQRHTSRSAAQKHMYMPRHGKRHLSIVPAVSGQPPRKKGQEVERMLKRASR